MHAPHRIRLNPFVVTGALTLAVVGTTTMVMAVQSEDRRQVRRYQTWYIDGPPCPTWTVLPAVSSPLSKAFDIAQVRIIRQHGHMTCWSLKDHGGRGPGDLLVCHMLSPGRVEVRSRFGVSRFDPGEGGPATILVDRTSVRCVSRINADLFAASAQRAYD